MNLRRDPEALLRYRAILDSSGVLDRPADCLTDDEVVEQVERFIGAMTQVGQKMMEAFTVMAERIGEALAPLAKLAQEIERTEAMAVIEEAERITREPKP